MLCQVFKDHVTQYSLALVPRSEVNWASAEIFVCLRTEQGLSLLQGKKGIERKYSSADLFKPKRMRVVTIKVMMAWFVVSQF